MNLNEIKDWKWIPRIKFGPFKSGMNLNQLSSYLIDEVRDRKYLCHSNECHVYKTIFNNVTIFVANEMLQFIVCRSQFWYDGENILKKELQEAFKIVNSNISTLYQEENGETKYIYTQHGLVLSTQLNKNVISSVTIDLSRPIKPYPVEIKT